VKSKPIEKTRPCIFVLSLVFRTFVHVETNNELFLETKKFVPTKINIGTNFLCFLVEGDFSHSKVVALP
jgi:hypothetical protein